MSCHVVMACGQLRTDHEEVGTSGPWNWRFSSVQLSHVRLFETLWITAYQASLSITNSQSLLKLMSIESVMPSSHLILCHPLLLLPPISPSIRVFSNESTLRMRWPKYWSFSFNISPCNEHPGLICFRMNWLDLLAVQGTLKSLLQHHSSKASILRYPAFFTVQLSHPHMTRNWRLAVPKTTKMMLLGPLMASFRDDCAVSACSTPPHLSIRAVSPCLSAREAGSWLSAQLPASEIRQTFLSTNLACLLASEWRAAGSTNSFQWQMLVPSVELATAASWAFIAPGSSGSSRGELWPHQHIDLLLSG